MVFFNHLKHKGRYKGINSLVIPLCIFIFTTFTTSSSQNLFAQISYGGYPMSFENPELLSGIRTIALPSPDMEQVRASDVEIEKQGLPRRVGIAVSAGIDLFSELDPQVLHDGSKIWTTTIQCDGALALGLYFDDFELAEGYSMFVYNEKRDFLLGAYTLYNNDPSRLFSIELVPGDRLVVEINARAGSTELSSCSISEISYVYRDFSIVSGSRGTADDCEVNINCPEGDNWQYQKHGVARIYVKEGGGYFWCTGSLVNNTLQNNEPYFLTADHCAQTASAEDIMQWVFYFNYEAPGCENPTSTPASNSMTGAVKLANANTSGSDFLLLRLADTVPLYYEPYFNGWSIENVTSPSGVTIHHPAGDIKKISTYTAPLKSSNWLGTPGTHWEVYWSETETNWGVTEGGSSGSPLFDNTGKIVGALTGGQAACETDGSGSGTGPDEPDFYGKFSYSWDQNGEEPSEQLKYWLDPINLGVTTLNGKYSDLTAAFQASETLILTGSMVEYTNLSSGLPVSWEWRFEGGTPASYVGENPGDVLYASAGTFDVTLIVSDGFDEDTLHLKDFIHVVGKVYPNPTTGKVNIFLEEELPASLLIQVYDILGHLVFEEQVEEQSYQLVTLNLATLSSGAYTIRIKIKDRFLFARVLLK
jgi:hypothetical protein